GLCRPHHVAWIKASRTKKNLFKGTREEWVRDVASPFEAFPRCRVLGCPMERITLEGGICRIHYNRWRHYREAQDQAPDFEDWLRHATPYLSLRQFSLAALS
ncbi:hypothetical protein ADL35_26615, partial [Streptomyces sp. NRRL WC-3753]